MRNGPPSLVQRIDLSDLQQVNSFTSFELHGWMSLKCLVNWEKNHVNFTVACLNVICMWYENNALPNQEMIIIAASLDISVYFTNSKMYCCFCLCVFKYLKHKINNVVKCVKTQNRCDKCQELSASISGLISNWYWQLPKIV